MGLLNCFKIFTLKRGRSRAKGVKDSPTGGPSSSATAPATFPNAHPVPRPCKFSSSPQIPRLTSESLSNDDDKKTNPNDSDSLPLTAKKDAGANDASYEKEESLPPPVPADKSPEDLWQKSFEAMSEEEQGQLKELMVTPAEIWSTEEPTSSTFTGTDFRTIIEMTRERQKQWNDRTYKFKIRGPTILGTSALQFLPQPASIVWPLVKGILQVPTNADAETAVAALTADILIRNISCGSAYEEIYRGKVVLERWEMLRSALVKLYVAALKLLIFASKRFRKHTASHLIEAILSPQAGQNQVTDLKSRYSELLEIVQYCQNEVTGRMSENVNDILKALEKFRGLDSFVVESFDTLFERMDEQRVSAILNWVSPNKPFDRHNPKKKDRAADTCRWILHDPIFEIWERSISPEVIWLQGSIGTGKSVLTSMVIDHLLETQEPTEGLAFYYCERRGQSFQISDDVIRSLLRQLACSPEKEFPNRKIHKDLQSLCQDGKSDDQTRYRDLHRVPASGSRHELFKEIINFFSTQSGHSIRVFVSARPEPDIMACFEKFPVIATENPGVQKDIKSFIRNRITCLWDNPWTSISKEVQTETIDILTEKSNGMFQWVNLQIEQLKDCDIDSAVRERLAIMPKELSDAYNEIYDRISRVQSQKQLVDCAFKWVMCSYSPVSPEYIVTAVRFLGDRNAPEEEISIERLLGLCQNLLVIDESTGYLRFPHASVVESIEKELWDTRAADCYASKACLQCPMVAHGEEEEGTTYTTERTARALVAADDSSTHLTNHFHMYCRYHWMHHAQRYETMVSNPEDFDNGLISLLKRFLDSPTQSGPFYQRWYHDVVMDGRFGYYPRLYELIDEDRFLRTYRVIAGDLSPPTLPILAMCSFGLDAILLDWWESAGALYNSLKNSKDESLLILAVKTNHLPICQRLVENGAPIDYECDGGNALYLAAKEGHRDIVEILVQNKASVNHVNRYHGTALTAAVSHDHLDIARLLVKRGAGVGINLHGESGETPLGAAASRGSLEAIQFLLDEGADINQLGEYHRTPLVAAACYKWGSPLAAVAYTGRLELMQLLIANGAIINLPGGSIGCPLAAAAAGGELEAARFLLDKGANVNLVSGSYGSALAAAAYYGELNAVHFLVQNGADINMPLTGPYGSVLAIAAFEGHFDVIRLLVDRGAMVDLPLENGLVGSELAGAAWAGDVEIVEYLISKGATIDGALSGFFGSALAAAAYKAEFDSVRLLIDKGASVHLQLVTGSLGSALAAAAAAGSVEIVMFLIEKGADVNQALVTGKHKTALSAASYWGQVECVKALLNAGAVVDFPLNDISPEIPVEASLLRLWSSEVPSDWDNVFSFPWRWRSEYQMADDKQEVMRILENHAKTHS
ncbi:ankyrin repeat domain-containing protein [Aspergillus neoniger CBS 115656]|uniref:Ankyrin n=1 Tax=Aspergillus neoniger (strain CBS 115656) TaxID=1448310 RepID=A0A318YM10_ASPNB|nr:ankyrin [Aspergillus neoniger CBS 115656]PYH35256.1 ankyrin [Aspergillus neoniger CBS 115656]